MQVTVAAALRFRGASHLERGLEAFDARACPEFFRRELWTVVGVFALCTRTFELEADRDYFAAFSAIADEAMGGVIDLRESGRRGFRRLAKTPPFPRFVPFAYGDGPLGVPGFGEPAARHRGDWADAIAKARSSEARRVAKARGPRAAAAR